MKAFFVLEARLHARRAEFHLQGPKGTPEVFIIFAHVDRSK